MTDFGGRTLMVVKMVVEPIANLSKLASSGQASLMMDVGHHMSRSVGGGRPIDQSVRRDSGLMLYVFVYGVERGPVPAQTRVLASEAS